ncbi:hypothetical protein V3481_011025 [Fusarium oxysporum f. sp. vasinfectum]|uniref:Uncharacterized protein n=1 Tax=Fusarium oxysporum f. sp. vasinfectum 25433 TaxID=1089449 RepID=X0MLE0_FUSOX|nr:hypothetical protein FOTG_01245 [Fusarium oxysporum f. sp. vasinfectum 25433]
MEESAPKRRRTSPRTSLNIGASEEPASPQRRRPSYASPTKASMSRNNPEAFERRRSRSPQKLPSARASGQFTFDSPSEALAARLATSRIVSDAPTPTRPEDTTPGSIRRVGGGMASAARRTSSRAGARAEEDDFNPFRGKVLRRSPQAGIRMDVDVPSASMPQPELPPAIEASSPPAPPASMPEPQLRLPSDEPMVEPEENTPIQSEDLAPAEETSPAKPPSAAGSPSPARSFSSYNLEIPARSSSPIRSPSPAEAAPAPEPEVEEELEEELEQGVEQESETEPEQESGSELEADPQPDPESERDSPSPPSPLPDFSSSPPPASMPPPRIPPLVQPDSQDAAPSASQPVPRLPPRDTGPRKSFQNSPVRFREFSQQRDSPLAKPPSRLLEKPRKSFAQAGSALREQPPVKAKATEVRQPRAFDPDGEKKKERDRVQREIQDLKKDLEIARKENERIRLMQQSSRTLAPTNQDEVISLIERHLMSTGTEQSKTASQQLLQAALNPAALLPFSKPTAPVVRPSVEEKQPDIKSHHPVAMTATEELPYLELFTPFSMTSNTSVLPEADGEPLRQHYSITLRSREIPGIFTAKIEMTVNATDLTVLDLGVTALEPAAKSELGPFIRKICTGDCNRSMQRNIGILSWAMGEWLRVAIDRAGFWCQLEQSLDSKDGVSEAAARMRSKKHRRRRDSGEDSDEDEPTRVEYVKKADLIRCLGQQHFDISIPYGDAEESGSTVRLKWKTEFDWTGEAQTRLSVLVGAPGKWHQTDERGSLAKIPKLFEELVHGHEEPGTAVRTIVALIAGEQS